MKLTNHAVWNCYAGGVAAAEGRNSYDIIIPGLGQYIISPICYRHSLRHRGFVVYFANRFGAVRQGGLYKLLATGSGHVTSSKAGLPGALRSSHKGGGQP